MMIYFMTKYLTHFTKVLNLFNLIQPSHPAIKRRGYVVTMSLCASQQRHRYVSNETPNDVSVERRQDISVACFHNVLLDCCEDISRRRNGDVPSVPQCLKQVSNETSTDVKVVRHRDVSVVCGHDVPLVRLYEVSCKSQMKHPILGLW